MESPNAHTVSVAACGTYLPDVVRGALAELLAPLGGMRRFVRPGMRVLLKPNLVNGAGRERGITTHPVVIQAVAELAREAGGKVWVGDSPGGPLERNAYVMRRSGAAAAAETAGADLVSFDSSVWKQLNGVDYFIASQVLEADLVIDLPKLKTHMLTLYTGAIKNLYGVIPGRRKRELHLLAPGVQDFSRFLVDALALVRPGLTIMDGVRGLEGNGPGVSGKPHLYRCLAASADPVALDAVMARALGFREGEVLHIAQAGERGMGTADPGAIEIAGPRRVLDFGPLDLPAGHWFFRAPAWAAAPLRRLARVRPRLDPALCVGCGQCAEVCPRDVITPGRPPAFDLDRCIGCLCCAEICPQGAIQPQRSLLARLIGIGY